MSHNYYSEINLHIVWHTKQNCLLLTPTVEPLAHESIRKKCVTTEGVFVHEIGGADDHVHIALSVVPTVAISELIGQLKGASSHDVNEKLGGKRLQWQVGYGVVSFGTGDLEWVKRYVRCQREHHAQGKAVDRLERITRPER